MDCPSVCPCPCTPATAHCFHGNPCHNTPNVYRSKQPRDCVDGSVKRGAISVSHHDVRAMKSCDEITPLRCEAQDPDKEVERWRKKLPVAPVNQLKTLAACIFNNVHSSPYGDSSGTKSSPHSAGADGSIEQNGVFSVGIGINPGSPSDLLSSEEGEAGRVSGDLTQLRGNDSQWDTKFVAETNLPTDKGLYRVRAYRSVRRRAGIDGGFDVMEPIALIYGDAETLQRQQRHDSGTGVALRVHDACFTSEVLGSLKCDCRPQLEFAKDYIRGTGGVVIYLQQEGRGIGLANKVAAYALQELGFDTVDANRRLRLPDDAREYPPVAHILQDMGISRIRLLTNNPRKVSELRKLGVQVVGRLPVVVGADAINGPYLRCKANRMAHMLPLDGVAKEEINDGIPAL